MESDIYVQAKVEGREGSSNESQSFVYCDNKSEDTRNQMQRLPPFSTSEPNFSFSHDITVSILLIFLKFVL